MKWSAYAGRSLFALSASAGVLLYAQGSPQTGAQEQNVQTYVNLLRQDVKSQKVAIISQMMQFTPEQAAVFWPVYTEYDRELTKLGDEKLALIRDYAEHYDRITDQKADELVHRALDLEAGRTTLKRNYYKRFQDVMSARAAAKLLQVENQLLMVIDLQIASSLPVLE